MIEARIGLKSLAGAPNQSEKSLYVMSQALIGSESPGNNLFGLASPKSGLFRMRERQSLVQTYETITVLAFFSLATGLWFRQAVFLYAACVFLFLMVFLKKAASWLAWGWLQFAHVIGTVNNKIILTLIFFLILTPLAFCYRLFHGDFMRIKKKPPISNWQPRNHTYTKSDLEKAW